MPHDLEWWGVKPSKTEKVRSARSPPPAASRQFRVETFRVWMPCVCSLRSQGCNKSTLTQTKVNFPLFLFTVAIFRLIRAPARGFFSRGFAVAPLILSLLTRTMVLSRAWVYIIMLHSARSLSEV
jgi:hypothetical protein